MVNEFTIALKFFLELDNSSHVLRMLYLLEFWIRKVGNNIVVVRWDLYMLHAVCFTNFIQYSSFFGKSINFIIFLISYSYINSFEIFLIELKSSAEYISNFKEEKFSVKFYFWICLAVYSCQTSVNLNYWHFLYTCGRIFVKRETTVTQAS